MMRITRIQEADMQTAMERIRGKLGPDAVIISTRGLGSTTEERRRGLRGIEVIAGVEDGPGEAKPTAQAAAKPATQASATPRDGVASAAARFAYGGGAGTATAAAANTGANAAAAGSSTRTAAQARTADRGLKAALEREPGRGGSLLNDWADEEPEFVEEAVVSKRPARGAQGRQLRTARISTPRFPQIERSGEALEEIVPAATPTVMARELQRAADILSEPGVRESAGAAPSASTFDFVPSSAMQRTPAPAANVFDFMPSEPVAAPVARQTVNAPVEEPVAARRGTTSTSAAHKAAEQAYTALRLIGLGDELAEQALEEAITVVPVTALTDSGKLVETALERVAGWIPSGPALRRDDLAGQAVFFVGPAGAGKTTALLKAAVTLRRAGVDTALIAADVSRAGAVEQMQRYAQLLRLPVETAYTPEDLAQQMAAAPAGRVVLVDTAACALAPRAGANKELEALLQAAPSRTVIYTLAAGAGEAELRAATNLCERFGAAAVALTKVDDTPLLPETSAVDGFVLNVLATLRLPSLLCSLGRDVLSDMSTATAEDLAAAALEAFVAAEPREDVLAG